MHMCDMLIVFEFTSSADTSIQPIQVEQPARIEPQAPDESQALNPHFGVVGGPELIELQDVIQDVIDLGLPSVLDLDVPVNELNSDDDEFDAVMANFAMNIENSDRGENDKCINCNEMHVLLS